LNTISVIELLVTAVWIRTMKAVRISCVVSLIAVFCQGCGLLGQEEEDAAVIVGSTRISLDQFKRDMQYVSAVRDIPEKDREIVEKQLMGHVVDQYLILEYGKEKGIALAKGDLQNAIKTIREGYTEEAFQESILREYVDYEQWKQRLEQQLLIKKILKDVAATVAPPSHTEMKAYYEANQDRFQCPKSIRFRQIVTRTREEAEGLLKRLRDGEEMAKLAPEFSIAPEAADGGLVDWIAEEQLEESMGRALLSLPVGKVSDVVETPYGYHIFEVLARRPLGRRDLPEVLQELEEELFRKKCEIRYTEWLEELRSRYPVKIDYALLSRVERS
jgi:parvulin-like peptidyl-prolyl isomerase